MCVSLLYVCVPLPVGQASKWVCGKHCTVVNFLSNSKQSTHALMVDEFALGQKNLDASLCVYTVCADQCINMGTRVPVYVDCC